MNLLDRHSLAKTVDRVNAAVFSGNPPDRETCDTIIDWIVTRHATPNAYAGTFGLTEHDERARLRTFTGEPLASRVMRRHIVAEEACRVLLRLGRVTGRRIPELDAAGDAFRDCLRSWEPRGDPPGTYCCGPCTVGLWRHLVVGGLGDDGTMLDAGIGALRDARDATGGWGRYPFYYTLSVLVEAPGENAARELVFARPACERRLKGLRATMPFGGRRRTLLEQVLARAA